MTCGRSRRSRRRSARRTDMEFENRFEVDAPIDEVFKTMLDLERVAPCVPGAKVVEKTSDTAYKVEIKVKLGPVQMTYKGDVEVAESDESAHRALMRISAREARGQGTAKATTELRLTEEGGKTVGAIKADVSLSGRAASMGRGITQDVSAKMIDPFAATLATMLDAPAAPAEETAGNGAGPAAAKAAPGGGATTTATADAPPRQQAPPPPPQDDDVLDA